MLIRTLGYAGATFGAVALLASLASYVALWRGGRLTPDYLRRRGLLDGWLLLTWTALTAGSVGLLAYAPWSPAAVRGALGMLVLWSLLYAGANLRAYALMAGDLPARRPGAIVGIVFPVVLVAALAVGVHLTLARAGL